MTSKKKEEKEKEQKKGKEKSKKKRGKKKRKKRCRRRRRRKRWSDNVVPEKRRRTLKGLIDRISHKCIIVPKLLPISSATLFNETVR